MALIMGLVIPADSEQDMYLRTFYAKYSDDDELQEIAFRTLKHVIDCRTIEVLAMQDNHMMLGGRREYSAFADEEANFVENPARNLRATQVLGFPYLLTGTVIITRYQAGVGDVSVRKKDLIHLEAEGMI